MKIARQKHSLLPILLICLLLSGSSYLLSRVFSQMDRPSSFDHVAVSTGQTEYAILSPLLLDAQTSLPIAGGTVCIPEISLRATTLSNGRTEPLRVPILRDARYRTIQEKPWGELLLLIYADGYAPTAYLYTGLYPDTQISGPTICLQPQNGKEVYYIAEEPNDLWLRALLEKYASRQNIS